MLNPLFHRMLLNQVALRRCVKTSDLLLMGEIDMLEEDLSPACASCGKPATRIKLIHEVGGVRFRYEGICGGNGSGDLMPAARVDAIRTAFTTPYAAEKVKLADLYDDGGFCVECGNFYCFNHWNVSTTGGGSCPKGHFKSLDPHWSPND